MASWGDREVWETLRDGSACWTCASGAPKGFVLAETPTVWVCTQREVTCRGYIAVFTKRHAVEPYELSTAERAAFSDAGLAAAHVLDDLFSPVKLNYEIHGNTNPHLHLHIFPRYAGDPFEDGPIRASERNVTHSDEDIDRMRIALVTAGAGSF